MLYNTISYNIMLMLNEILNHLTQLVIPRCRLRNHLYCTTKYFAFAIRLNIFKITLNKYIFISIF